MTNQSLNFPTLLVLAGGFGTRLRSVVSDVPKPMAPVGDRPFLHYQIKNWIRQGVKSFIFLLHHEAGIIIDYLESERHGLFKSCDLEWLVEPEPLGTGGAVAYVVKEFGIDRSFMVTNADTWLGSGIAEIKLEEVPSMAVIHVPDSGRYGSVQIDGSQINLFKEKSESTGSGWINAGLCHLVPSIFANWDTKPFSMESIVFPTLAAGGTLKAVKIATEFIDIGIPSDYQKFCDLITLEHK